MRRSKKVVTSDLRSFLLSLEYLPSKDRQELLESLSTFLEEQGQKEVLDALAAFFTREARAQQLALMLEGAESAPKEKNGDKGTERRPSPTPLTRPARRVATPEAPSAQSTHNLKSVFNDLRNYLAGNATGITRDETLAREIINLLFCKIHDELRNGNDAAPRFVAAPNEPPEEVHRRITHLFEEEVKSAHHDVFLPTERLSLDTRSLAHVVSVLQSFHLTTAIAGKRCHGHSMM